jgi:carbamoyl-phosphate synthase small subunit
MEAPMALLLLADGSVWRGRAIGARGTTAGEICFNTGMTGYQEVFTDPSYSGQIVCTTHVHIGNYGVTSGEDESNSVKISGLVVRNFSEVYSRHGAFDSLQDYLAAQGIVGIAGIDTRQLVRHIRAKGAMNAIISTELLEPSLLADRLAAVPDMAGLEMSSAVSTPEAYWFSESGGHRVAVMDYGVKRNILQSLAKRGCRVQVFPARTPAAEVLATKPDGVLLSNGPGDPAAMDYAVAATKEFVNSATPVFGICLGNQLLGLAAGARTLKMPYGHRGLNHPVKNLLTGLAEITSQNHGFSIDADSLAAAPDIELTHVNLNDHSVEGIRLRGKNAFSVQYHPESNPGPHDSAYLFDQFVAGLS